MIDSIISIVDIRRAIVEKQEQQELELLDLFRQMDHVTQNIFLSHGRIAIVAEDCGKKVAFEFLKQKLLA
jgi:hypothetical protein